MQHHQACVCHVRACLRVINLTAPELQLNSTSTCSVATNVCPRGMQLFSTGGWCMPVGHVLGLAYATRSTIACMWQMASFKLRTLSDNPIRIQCQFEK
jgi:hypothetical protein